MLSRFWQVSCYLITHYGFSVPEAVACLSILRPGSGTTSQHCFLEFYVNNFPVQLSIMYCEVVLLFIVTETKSELHRANMTNENDSQSKRNTKSIRVKTYMTRIHPFYVFMQCF